MWIYDSKRFILYRWDNYYGKPAVYRLESKTVTSMFHRSNINLLICVLKTGQLNEYTERKEMSSDVVCMALGRVPSGEQRSRFLAVGLSDNTVRIISLDPSVSLRFLS